MNSKLGRSGILEGISAASVAMCANGFFDVDAEYAYKQGNFTYVTLPLSALLSAVLFAFAAYAMKKRRAATLYSLLEYSFGSFVSVLAAVPICVSLVFCAAEPLTSITQVLDTTVYEGVEYPTLFAFIFPVTAFIAFRGMETIARTAKVFAGLLAVSVAAAFVFSLPGQQSYRMFPLPMEGAARFAGQTASQSIAFLPPLAALLIASRGFHGAEHVRRAGVSAALITAAACFVVQFMLSRLYSYKALADIFMPLCRVRYLNIEKSYVIWLDKLLIMTWMNGCIIAGAYCIYAAALLCSEAFRQKDVGPSVIFFAFITGTCALIEFGAGISVKAAVHDVMIRWGAMAAALPVAAASLIAALKKKRRPRRKR